MRKKTFNKKMMLLLVPAMACTLATGIPDVSATNTTLAPGITIGPIVLGSSDTLTVPSTATLAATNTSAAVYVTGNANGAIVTNSGIISVLNTTTGTSPAAIYIKGNLTGSLVNTGTISATVTAASSDAIVEASAYGISMGNLSGTLTNSGIISGTASATSTGSPGGFGSALVSAYGLHLSGLSGSLTNSGTLSATATASSLNTWAEATAYGISMDGNLSGVLTNSGTISAAATASGSFATATAYGIEMASLSGSLTNSGTISATATATGTTEDAYARAYGISMGDLSGVLTNSGTISATATATQTGGNSDAQAYAYGIDMGKGDLAGFLINSGTITATAKATAGTTATATAYGIRFNTLYGSLNNSGTISATATAIASNDSAEAYAYGIDMGDLSGSLINSGTITATATATSTASSADATAYGISLGTLSGKLENSGTIAAIAIASTNSTSEYAYATAYGIVMRTSTYSGTGAPLSGSLVNSGTISATATASAPKYYADAEAYGIDMGNLQGILSNSSTGIIKGTATATGSEATAYAYGIYMDTLSGSLTNNGIISGTATATATGSHSADATAYGIAMGTLSGSLTNTGTISATATAIAAKDRASASAYGIVMWSTLSGSLTNSGTIAATATASGTSASAEAYGISMGNLSGSLKNSGTISATATATATGSDVASASAYGIYMHGDLSGTLTNSGTITATATATNNNASTQAEAYGIALGSLSGTLTNSGSISATATANAKWSASADAYGINMHGELSGTLTNSGSITATATATGKDDYVHARAFGIDMPSYGSYMGAEGSITADGTLVNSGSITATATSTADKSSAAARAYGVSMGGDIDGSLVNSGSITATATAISSAPGTADYPSVSAEAYGIKLGYYSSKSSGMGSYSSYSGGEGNVTADGTLTNSGSIIATANAQGKNAEMTSASAVAIGILAGNITGTLTNSGTITATATAATMGKDPHASTVGIYVDNVGSIIGSSPLAVMATSTTVPGTLVNSGTITATATATGAGAYAGAVGIYANSVGDQFMTYSGTPGLNAMAIVSGSLVNSGTITATAHANGAGASADAVGVYVGNLTGSLINSGSISGIADLPQNGYSLYVDGGEGGVVENLAGGLLSGNLNVDGNVAVTNSGTIALPAMDTTLLEPTGAVTTLGMGSKTYGWIADNYTQTAGGVLSFGATTPTTYARLQVGNTAAFAADTTLHVKLTPGNTIAVGTTLNDVVTAGTLDASTFKVTDNSALLAFTSVIDGNTIDLTAAQVFAADIIGPSGWSSANGAAGALDRMLAVYGTPDAYPGMDGALADLRALETDQQVAAAIVTTLPSLRLELPRLTLDNMHHGIDLTRERDDSARGLSSGAGLVENGYLWFSGLGSSASQSNGNGAFGYDADTYGFMIGGDKAVGERARIGLAFGFSHSDVDGDTLAYQNADVKSYQPLLYGSYALDNKVNLTMHLGYGWHDNEITRFVPLAGTTFKGDYDSSSINAGIAASRSYKMDEKTIFTPSVRLDYGYIDNDSYSENSLNALSLAVSDSNVDELILGIDGKVTHKLNHDWNLTGKIGIGYDMLADEDSVNSSYAGAPGVGFSTNGTDPSSWLYRGGVGVVYGKPDTLEVSLRYNLEGREDYTNQSLSLKLNKMF